MINSQTNFFLPFQKVSSPQRSLCKLKRNGDVCSVSALSEASFPSPPTNNINSKSWKKIFVLEKYSFRFSLNYKPKAVRPFSAQAGVSLLSEALHCCCLRVQLSQPKLCSSLQSYRLNTKIKGLGSQDHFHQIYKTLDSKISWSSCTTPDDI